MAQQPENPKPAGVIKLLEHIGNHLEVLDPVKLRFCFINVVFATVVVGKLNLYVHN
jgi:hypothetical protein